MVSFRFSALTWVLYTKDAKALAGYVSDPRSGEILKANVMVGDSWERSWIKKLAVLDMSDGQSAVMRHILGGNNKTTTITAPPPNAMPQLPPVRRQLSASREINMRFTIPEVAPPLGAYCTVINQGNASMPWQHKMRYQQD